ncbi:MAG: type II toxin-antitoxin system VapC family toxin [Deltaproteobacteria bacterium]|nr:type II toxin-antitoxin system VapC family toxin [Deltaproteobacteria bacterium]
MGEVEVVVRPWVADAHGGVDVFEFIASLPPGNRERDDIDRQVAFEEPRASWGRSVNRLYLDACAIIYLVEAVDPFHAHVARRLQLHGAGGESDVVTSLLSRLECRTRPLRDNDEKLIGRLVLSELSPGVIERATVLRARHGFKTPDALHLASAIEMGASVFLTGDRTLARCDEINVEIIEARG